MLQHSLGAYVVTKTRKDGTDRLYFQVPRRLRPDGWLPAIPIARAKDRSGPIADDERPAIIESGKHLFDQLIRARLGLPEIEAKRSRTMRDLVLAWQKSPEWRSLRPSTKEGYSFNCERVLAWADECGDPDPSLISQPNVRSFLANFDDRPRTKKAVLKVVALIMQQAVALGWRTDNPARGIRVPTPKSRVGIWEQTDVDLYVNTARQSGRVSIALIILLVWEIGQRLTDVRGFRPGAEYDAERGVFSFRQSKTDAAVTLQVSTALRDMLGEREGVFIFYDEVTGKPYSQHRLSSEFAKVRTAAVPLGGRSLVLRHLRHSCVVQLARASCTTAEIAAVTGHTMSSVNSILATYLPRDGRVARNALIKRGLIERNDGGEPL